MSSLELELTKCRAALSVMYDQPDVDQETRSQANAYLNQIQTSTLIWEVADRILSAPGLSQAYYFYAANALVHRLRTHFKDLADRAARITFRQQLQRYLDIFTSITDSNNEVSILLTPAKASNIIDRLCLCYSLLIIHLISNNDWPTALTDITSAPPSNPIVLLTILEDIPECLHDRRLYIVTGHEGVRTVKNALNAFQAPLLHLTMSFLSSTKEVALLKRVFSALAAWCQHQYLHLQHIHAHPVFQALFQALPMPALTEVACVSLSGLLASYPGGEDPASLQLMEGTVAMTLGAVYPLYTQHLQADNTDICKAILNVVVDLCFFALPLITRAQQRAYYEASPARGDVLAHCSENNDAGLACLAALAKLCRLTVLRHTTYANASDKQGDGSFAPPSLAAPITAEPCLIPGGLPAGANGDVSEDPWELRDLLSSTFQLWYQLQHRMGDLRGDLSDLQREYEDDLYHAQDSGDATPSLDSAKDHLEAREAAYRRRVAELSPVLLHVLISLTAAQQLPRDHGSYGKSERDDVRARRRDVEDAVADVAEIMPAHHVMAALGQQLTLEYEAYVRAGGEVAGEAAWQALEAPIHALRTLCRHFTRCSQTSAGLLGEEDPSVRAALDSQVGHFAQLLLSVRGSADLRYSAVLALGRYAELLRSHPDVLAPMLQNIVADLAVPAVAPAAAIAFRNVCEACSVTLAQQYVPNILAVYQQCGVLLPQEQREITHGVAMVLRRLPYAACADAIDAVVAPIRAALDALTATRNPLSAEAGSIQGYLQRMLSLLEAIPDAHNPDNAQVLVRLVDIVESMSGYLVQLIHLFQPEDSRVDSACQWWKYALVSAGVHAQKLVPSLCTTLCEAFAHTQQSVFLYVASIIVRTFPPGQYSGLCFDPQEVAVKFLNFFVPPVLTALSSDSGFADANPDLCEDLLGFLLVYADFCPDLLVSSPLLPHIFTAVSSMVGVTHKYLFHIVIDLLCALYKDMNGNWYHFLPSQLYPILYEANAELLHRLFAAATGNRRTGDSLHLVHLLPPMLSFHIRINSPRDDAPVPAHLAAKSAQYGKGAELEALLESVLNQPAFSEVGEHLRKELVEQIVDFEHVQTDRMRRKVQSLLSEVLSAAKGETDEQEKSR